jgi:hypothetical protein
MKICRPRQNKLLLIFVRVGLLAIAVLVMLFLQGGPP